MSLPILNGRGPSARPAFVHPPQPTEADLARFYFELFGLAPFDDDVDEDDFPPVQTDEWEPWTDIPVVDSIKNASTSTGVAR